MLVLAIGFVWLMVASASFRKVGFGLIALAALVITAIWVNDQNSNREFRAEVVREKSAIPHSAVELRNLTLGQGLNSTVLGTVVNNARSPIRSLTIQVSTLDCPELTSLEGCIIIGQDDATAYVDVPPGQARQLYASVNLRSAATPTGHWRWKYELKDVTANLSAQH